MIQAQSAGAPRHADSAARTRGAPPRGAAVTCPRAAVLRREPPGRGPGRAAPGGRAPGRERRRGAGAVRVTDLSDEAPGRNGESAPRYRAAGEREARGCRYTEVVVNRGQQLDERMLSAHPVKVRMPGERSRAAGPACPLSERRVGSGLVGADAAVLVLSSGALQAVETHERRTMRAEGR